MKFTKRSLALRISAKFDLSLEKSGEIVDLVCAEMTSSLGRGEFIEFRNFGTFAIKKTRPRTGRDMKNPSRAVAIPARVTVRFRPGKVLRARLARKTG